MMGKIFFAGFPSCDGSLQRYHSIPPQCPRFTRADPCVPAWRAFCHI